MLERAGVYTPQQIALLNRLAELAEALVAEDQRRLAHACYAWAYALDPTLADDRAAQQQVRANLALSGMWHPTQAGELREVNLDRLIDRLRQELAIAQRGGAELRRVLPILRRLVELAGLPASKARLPRVAHAELLVALAPLVWAGTLPRAEIVGPVTAFRLRLLGVPDPEIFSWLPATGGPWWWVWTGDLSALTSWLHRKTEPLRPIAPGVEAALEQLDSRVSPLDPDAEDADRAGTRALIEALRALHTALHAERRTREEALVAAFLAALQGEPSDTPWLHTHHLPELLHRVASARLLRGAAQALRAVERITPSNGGS